MLQCYPFVFATLGGSLSLVQKDYYCFRVSFFEILVSVFPLAAHSFFLLWSSLYCRSSVHTKLMLQLSCETVKEIFRVKC